MELLHKTCICGCGKSFRTSRATDSFASRACEELHKGQRVHPKKRAQSALPSTHDPRMWINARELAMRLGAAPSTITQWTQRGWIPFERDSQGTKVFKLDDVRAALHARREFMKKRY